MSLFNLDNPTPVTSCSGIKINKFAFDGVNYYYTMKCENAVAKVNIACLTEQLIKTNKIYDCICYDTEEKCFWATTKNDYTSIFKLNCSMKEIDCIFIETRGQISGNISSISYNCQNNSIYVAYPNQVLEVYKDGEYILRQEKYDSYITCVFSLPTYYYVVFYKEERQCVYGYNSENIEIYSQEIKKGSSINTILFNPKSDDSEWYIDILFDRNNCYAYLQKNLVTAETLGYTPEACVFDIATEGGCVEINSCDPVSDFVESIALIEASLAHILNAEGEKIQYAVAQETDMDTILSVNKSVTKTIVQVTHLEQVLHGILETLAEQGICFE